MEDFEEFDWDNMIEEREARPWYQKAFNYIWYRTNKIEDISYKIKWAWQRVFRGYDDRAVWGIGDWLARLAPDILEDLKNNKQGVPLPFLPELEEGHYEWTNEQTEEGRKKMNAVIDEIIAGFRAHLQLDEIPFDGDMNKYKKEEARIMKIRDDGLQLFVKYYDNLWD